MKHIARASWHVAVLQARQELHGYCKKKSQIPSKLYYRQLWQTLMFSSESLPLLHH